MSFVATELCYSKSSCLQSTVFQAQGRGRAEDSTYTVVEVKNSGVTEKECVNEYRKNMMDKAIDRIKTFSQADYDKRVC